MDIKQIVLDEIKEITHKENLEPEMNLFDDLTMSSLDIFEFIVNVEKKAGIEIDESRLGEVSTLQELIDAIAEMKKNN